MLTLYDYMQHDISWSEIKSFYSSKKEKWALTKSYYSGNPIWANCSSYGHPDGKYGYILLEPYLEDEIMLYEKRLGIELPTDLHDYLLIVSRELFSGSYPMVFILQDNGNDLTMDIGTFQLPIGTQLWDYGGCIKHGPWDGKMANCTEECEDNACGGMLTISESGCTDQSMIVVKGNEKGSIWNNGSGGDTLFRSDKKTFYDFITEPIRWDKRMKEKGFHFLNK